MNEQVDRTRVVFVVHGRNNAARVAVFAFLRSIGLLPLEWSRARHLTGKPSPYVGEILDAAFARAQAVVVLFTPDEIVRLRPEYANGPRDEEARVQAQARPNVLFEAGIAMGRDPSRTVLAELGSVRPFSDIGGRHMLRISNWAPSRKEFAERLRSAGCPVDMSGSDWLEAGDFEAPSELSFDEDSFPTLAPSALDSRDHKQEASGVLRA